MNSKSESRPMPPNNNGSGWARHVEYHKYLAEWYRIPREGITQSDLLDFAMYGDLVSQSYLCGLRKAISHHGETRPLLNYFEKLLLAHVQRLNQTLCDLAQEGRPAATGELWDQALKLSQTFCELALKMPEAFKTRAQDSLYMPSVRAKNPKFTADAKEIAEAIELSANTVGAYLEDNRTRIGALTARLVAECIHEIKRSRGHWESLFTPYKLPVAWPTIEKITPFLNRSQTDLIEEIRDTVGKEKTDDQKMESHVRFFCLLADCGVERLHFLLLPELSIQTAGTWWKKAIERMIETRFPSLLKEPAWERELKAVSRGTTADMRKELKDYCVGKVKQFASPLNQKTESL